MKRIRGVFTYFFGLWRPSLRLERSPERFLMPLILAVLTILAIFAAMIPLKIAAGGAYEARGVDGHLVVHVAQGSLAAQEFEAQLSALKSRLEENENIARVAVAAGPDLAATLETLFGQVTSEDQLYGGIVRLDLVERAGRDANLENLQFAISEFETAQVDDFISFGNYFINRLVRI